VYNKTLVLSAILLGGCSTLAVDDDFSDAIRSVSKRADYVSIEAKSIAPTENKSVGGNAIKNITQVVANYPIDLAEEVPDSYMSVELSYMKANYEYSSVVINGKELNLAPYAPTDETCSEHCTTTQYFSFPIENDVIAEAGEVGLTYIIKTDNNMSQLSFSIPAGYFQAITKERESNKVGKAPVASSSSTKASSQQSKPVEMTEYWFGEANQDERELFTQWAVANRKSAETSLVTESKSLEMLGYWYEKASTEEKTQILMWLLNQ